MAFGTFVQGVIKNATSSPAAAPTFATAVALKDVIIVGGTDDSGTTAMISAVTDSLGNTYAQVPLIYLSDGTIGQDVWMTQATHAGASNIVTVTFNSAIANLNFGVQHWNGFVGTATVDKIHVQANASSVTATSGASASTTVAAELIVGVFSHELTASAFSLGTGFTNLTTSNVAGRAMAMESKVVAATGVQTALATIAAARPNIGAVICIYDASSGTPASATQAAATITANGGSQATATVRISAGAQVAATVTVTGGTQTPAGKNVTSTSQVAATVTVTGGTQAGVTVQKGAVAQSAATITANGGTQSGASVSTTSTTQSAATITANGGTQSGSVRVNATGTQTAATITVNGGTQTTTVVRKAAGAQVAATITVTGGTQSAATVRNTVGSQSAATITANGGTQGVSGVGKASSSQAAASITVSGGSQTTSVLFLGGLYRWTGTIWQWMPIHVWNGTAWVIKLLNRWTGTAWQNVH